MIVQTIDNASQFRDAFYRMGRGTQFSYDGFQALFNFLEDIYSDSHPLELDPIALCCDFSEHSLKELQIEYPDHGTDEELIEYLRSNTTLLKIDEDTFIIQSF